MKKLLMILGVLMLFSSCSTYYYSTLSSSEGVAEKDDFGDFVYENDSVKVVYSFFGYNLPIHITVINNSDNSNENSRVYCEAVKVNLNLSEALPILEEESTRSIINIF